MGSHIDTAPETPDPSTGLPSSLMLEQLAEAVSTLYERAIDRVLLTPERVTSAAEGRALIASQESHEALAEQIQKVVVLAAPVVRAYSVGGEFLGVLSPAADGAWHPDKVISAT